jgi:hypothetical protein
MDPALRLLLTATIPAASTGEIMMVREWQTERVVKDRSWHIQMTSQQR